MSLNLTPIDTVQTYEETLNSFMPDIRDEPLLVGIFSLVLKMIKERGMPPSDSYSQEHITFDSPEDLFVKSQILTLQHLKAVVDGHITENEYTAFSEKILALSDKAEEIDTKNQESSHTLQII